MLRAKTLESSSLVGSCLDHDKKPQTVVFSFLFTGCKCDSLKSFIEYVLKEERAPSYSRGERTLLTQSRTGRRWGGGGWALLISFRSDGLAGRAEVCSGKDTTCSAHYKIPHDGNTIVMISHGHKRERKHSILVRSTIDDI